MAAEAIMTTDTFPKGAAATVEGDRRPDPHRRHRQGLGHDRARHGDDAGLYLHRCEDRPGGLQKMVGRNVGATFNSITVDSDTSTSDTLLVAATGRSGRAEVKGPVAKAFETALAGVMRDLALQVVRDGEGATKLVEVRVTGAASDADAAKVALPSPIRRW
jgi:glutamate N-acetyltransferase/amino-acid N-acetyltransferase